MKQEYEHLEDEINDLKHELEQFQHEKERVRAIIGKIGGVPKFRTKFINAIFIAVIVASVAVSIFSGEKLRRALSTREDQEDGRELALVGHCGPVVRIGPLLDLDDVEVVVVGVDVVVLAGRDVLAVADLNRGCLQVHRDHEIARCDQQPLALLSGKISAVLICLLHHRRTNDAILRER